MTLRKITIDNSVRYTSKDSHSHIDQAPHFSKQRDSKPNTKEKDASINKLSQKNKKFIKNITAEGFRVLE